MSDNMEVYIALACGAALCIYLFISAFLMGRTPSRRLMEKAKRDGTVTTAQCKKTHFFQDYESGRDDSVFVIYEYTVGGKKYRKSYQFDWIGVSADYPDTIEIYYSKRNPRRACSSADMNGEVQKRKGCYMTIVIPILIIIIIQNLLRLI